jgi:hypothetical protein
MPKHVVVHYIVLKYTSCDTVVFGYLPFSMIIDYLVQQTAQLIINNNFKESITKCSNELNNKLTSTRQHNQYLLEHIGYMFRPANRSSPDPHRNKSQVLFRYCDPNNFQL